jgi:hypothetical protein
MGEQRKRRKEIKKEKRKTKDEGDRERKKERLRNKIMMPEVLIEVNNITIFLVVVPYFFLVALQPNFGSWPPP